VRGNNYYRFTGITFDANNLAPFCTVYDSDSLDGSARTVMQNCVFENALKSGVTVGDTNYLWLVSCIARNNGDNGFSSLSAMRGRPIFMGCIAYGNGLDGYRFAYDSHIFAIGCLAYDNTGYGFNCQANYCAIHNCTAWDNGSHGIGFSGVSKILHNVTHCNSVANGGYGIYTANSTEAAIVINHANNLFGNTSGGTNVPTVWGDNLSTDPGMLAGGIPSVLLKDPVTGTLIGHRAPDGGGGGGAGGPLIGIRNNPLIGVA
jgi:hypothetical protein